MAKGQMTGAPMAHYAALYAGSDAREISARTGLRYDAEAGRFSLTLMGTRYYISHPVFEAPGLEPYEGILAIRYLLEGKHAPASGKMLSYEEMPWGPVYQAQFKGRLLGRIAREFGSDPSRLGLAVGAAPGLLHEDIGGADAAYRFEFLDGFFISVLVWEGDDEFPAAAQMLFSDNFKYAFTAEDMAVVGDVAVSRLKRSLKALDERTKRMAEEEVGK